MDPRPLLRIAPGNMTPGLLVRIPTKGEMSPELEEELDALNCKVRETKNGYDILLRKKPDGNFFLPTRVVRPRIILVSLERRVDSQTAFVVCGSRGNPMKARRRLPVDADRLKIRKAQALFESPFEVGRVTARVTSSSSNVTVEKFTVKNETVGVVGLERHVMFDGQISDLPPDLECFREACEAALRKAADPKGDTKSYFYS